MSDIILHFDGLCEPTNPGGHGCYGFVVADAKSTNVYFEGCGHLGTQTKYGSMTNNIAEYAALVHGLEWIKQNIHKSDIESLECCGDSQLVINQIAGGWNINKPHLRAAVDKAREVLGWLGCKWTLRWIPREQNEHADRLSQKAYEEATGQKVRPRR